MIRNTKPVANIRSQTTHMGRKPRIALLGGLMACMAFAAGAFNVVSASGNTADVRAPAAAVQSDPAATGQVVVFETETTAMTAFGDPDACNNAPEMAHTIMNFTDKDLTLFADDRCGVELIEVGPGFGSHVAPGQSFAAIG